MPLHQLPAELLRMICVYLKPADVAEIRLLDRAIAAVGLEYIVAQIHLIPTVTSFDRLVAVADDPATNRYVTSLYYEADLITSRSLRRDDREDWEKRIVGPEFAGPLEEIHDPDFASACDLSPRRFLRGPPVLSSQRQHNYTKREIQQGYEEYRRYGAEQRRINESVVYKEALVRALKKLPRLKSLIISCKRGNTNRFRAAFQPGLSEFLKSDTRLDNLVLGHQLALLLSAADRAGLQFTKLVCGSLGRCFPIHDAMTRSIRHLRSLHLFLSHISHASAISPLGPNTYLSGSAKFATSAPELETLSIRFDEDRPFARPDLKYFVGDFHWSWLISATFAKMKTSPDTLIKFCGRHRGTLKYLNLTDIALHTGLWALTFFEMRQRLELQTMEVAGTIQSHGGDYWDLTSVDRSIRRMIELYILHEDNMPRDITLDRFFISYKLHGGAQIHS